MLTCIAGLISKPLPAPETGTFQKHRTWEHGSRVYDSLCVCISAPKFLNISHISIFQELIKVNGLPDLRTAINVLPLVHLNFISMGFGKEKRYMSLWPDASLPPSACSLPCSWYLFVPLVLAYFLLSFPECWWFSLVYLIFFLLCGWFSTNPIDFTLTSSQ